MPASLTIETTLRKLLVDIDTNIIDNVTNNEILGGIP
jgi:hypothetical protein